MAEYRVEEVADLAGVTVELLRSYQSKGLLDPPRHEGRVAIYDDSHLERVKLILELKDQGWSLRMIAQHLDQPIAVPIVPTTGGSADSPADLDPGEEEQLSLRQVAERTRVPPSMLRSLEASGVLHPRRFGDEAGYTMADVRAVRMLLSLLGSGLPMEEFMRVARVQLEAIDEVVAGALD
ncbi:MAG: MerR family transcriptional regulator, partial [Acidimicrobiales bacterium]